MGKHGNWTRAVVTGKTWAIKETLKKHGARWDGATKSWTFQVVDDQERMELDQLLDGLQGVKVKRETEPAPPRDPKTWDSAGDDDGWQEGYSEVTEPFRGSGQGGGR